MPAKTAEERRVAREAKRKAKLAAYKAPPSTDTSSNWCLRNGKTIMLVTNIVFAVLGATLVGLGIYGSTGSFGSVFGTGPGFALAGLGGLVLLVAAAGQAGVWYNNKFILLAYFLLVFASLVSMAVLGGIAMFNASSLNVRFSDYWCDNPAEATSGQGEFDCCGYECPFDRPADGVCTLSDGSTVQPPGALSCDTVGDETGQQVVDAGKAVCEQLGSSFQGMEGCKAKGLAEANSRAVPLFGFAFATGMALFIGTLSSGYLLCRSSRGQAAATAASSGADTTALDANSGVPGSKDAPLASAATFALTDVQLVGVEEGGAAAAEEGKK